MKVDAKLLHFYAEVAQDAMREENRHPEKYDAPRLCRIYGIELWELVRLAGIGLKTEEALRTVEAKYATDESTSGPGRPAQGGSQIVTYNPVKNLRKSRAKRKAAVIRKAKKKAKRS